MKNSSPAPVFAFFYGDVGGWWSFKGLHPEKETALNLVEKFKHSRHCQSILVLELPSGHKAYEWSVTCP